MKIYLIRHAESEDCVLDASLKYPVSAYNALVQRIPHTLLTSKGEQQASELAKELAGMPVAHFYSSPFPRAQATATLLEQPLGRPAHILEEAYEVTPIALREHRLLFPLAWHFRHAYTLMLWPWGQQRSWWWHYVRARRVWQQLIKEASGDVVLVAHGWLIGMIVLSLLGNRTWHVVKTNLSNCGITLIEQRANKGLLVRKG